MYMINENTFKVVSTADEHDYTIHIYADHCSMGDKCVLHCLAPECYHLCQCIMECSCLDYKCGHICKHIHNVTIFSSYIALRDSYYLG